MATARPTASNSLVQQEHHFHSRLKPCRRASVQFQMPGTRIHLLPFHARWSNHEAHSGLRACFCRAGNNTFTCVNFNKDIADFAATRVGANFTNMGCRHLRQQQCALVPLHPTSSPDRAQYPDCGETWGLRLRLQLHQHERICTNIASPLFGSMNRASEHPHQTCMSPCGRPAGYCQLEKVSYATQRSRNAVWLEP